MQDIVELKPKRTSFMFSRLAGIVLACCLVAIGLAVVSAVTGTVLPALAGLMQLVVVVGLASVVAHVAYEKERYELHPHHLVVHRGGLVSSQTTELDLANVTHVKQHLPWVRYRFFDVGDVLIESAGSSGAEATLRSIRDPDRIYGEVRSRLRDNGFSLSSQEVVQRVSPALAGIVIECLARGGAVLIAFAWLFGGAVASFLSGSRSDDPGWLGGVLVLVGVVSLLGTLLTAVLHFFDMRRRTYTLTGDAVVYEEGFLNRDNAFIPFENIADADTRKTVLDQIVGLADVRVSCQGSSSEISFRRLAEAEQITIALKEMVDKAVARRAAVTASEAARDERSPAAAPARKAGFVPVSAPEAWTATLKMHPLRAVAGLVWIFPLVPVWLIATVATLLKAHATSFEVGRSSVSRRYRLLGENEVSFAYDKITAVIAVRNPFDRLLGTMTVRFFSIGSDTPLDLAHVPANTVNLPALCRQAGIPHGERLTEEPALFSPVVWARSAVGGFIAVACVAVAVLAAAVLHHMAWIAALGPLAIWLGVHFVLQELRARRQQLVLFEDHLELRSGILIRSHALARYDNVKKVEVLRYPGCDQGRVTFFVAGEMRLQQQRGASQDQGGAGIVQQCTLVAHFLTDIDGKRTAVDRLLSGGDYEQGEAARTQPVTVVAEARPALANSLTVLALLPPLWPLIPVVILQLKRRVYRVEADRMVVEQGILYRRHTSVLFDRIDSLKQRQGPLNKAFGNGTITLFTAGSSTPDLVLTAVPGHVEIYRLIRSHYGRVQG